jgi:hypothetical protein
VASPIVKLFRKSSEGAAAEVPIDTPWALPLELPPLTKQFIEAVERIAVPKEFVSVAEPTMQLIAELKESAPTVVVVPLLLAITDPT